MVLRLFSASEFSLKSSSSLWETSCFSLTVKKETWCSTFILSICICSLCLGVVSSRLFSHHQTPSHCNSYGAFSILNSYSEYVDDAEKQLMKMVCFSLRLFQALTEVATMVARALYLQAGGAETQLSSINADPQIVRLLDFLLKYSLDTCRRFLYFVRNVQ